MDQSFLPDIQLVIQANFFTASSPQEILFYPQALLCIGKNGKIIRIIRHNDALYDSYRALFKQFTLIQYPDHHYLLPGFVDLHLHAPQWPQLGKALDLPLADWLQQHTFPLEKKYASVEFARPIYQDMVTTLLANGTTTVLYFSSIHSPASLELARICLQKGQRALIGKVSMDNPEQCPEDYIETDTQQALQEVRDFIEAVRQLPQNETQRVQPVITPRFIPSCSDAMLQGLGEIAQNTGCHVQTHCSESDWAHQYGLDRYGKTDTATLNDFGLLTRKTILAHSNKITQDDFSLIKQQHAGIAHCPLSNFYFANCVFPLRRALEQQLHVGLGTDIAGGHSPSLFNACQHAITASKALQDGVDGSIEAGQRGTQQAAISYKEAFWLASAGGGIALDLAIGQIREDFYFDVMVIDTLHPHSNLKIWPDDRPLDILQKIIYNTERQNIIEVWVEGQKVV
ncbi:MAG: guanine deaminase [Acinetobacter populi]|jgi:guanine deaminase|uniref:guanine deaminase n=1 Tax=Acinetobacter populi TaxID=1582270 RepID=UPI0023523CDB|nr:guanine deaminase [Acinetobacter populi]MCH4248081.1 guanine deaminase [Acinetobacter populi]